MQISTKIISFFSLLLQTSLAHTPQHLGEYRIFNVKNNENQIIGSIKITQGHEGIVIKSSINCLPKGEHGFHIHQKASCLPETGFKSAGSHIGVVKTEEAREHACGYGKCEHGFLNRYGPQEGDLPNIISNCEWSSDKCDVENGCETSAEMYNHMLNLFEQDNEKPALLYNGAAIVIHEKMDEHVEGSDGIGNSGPRFACAEISAEI